MITDYKNKTALITGASSGIGREFALQLAQAGANLVLASRNTVKLNEVADVIEKSGMPGKVIEIIEANLELKEMPQNLFQIMKEKKIKVDLLVNNAGFGLRCRFEEEPFDRNLAMNMLNVVSLSSMCRLFIPPMLERGLGGVINVASTASFQPVPYMSNYAATKAFVFRLSLGLFEEYRKRGVHVMALCPGFTRTGFQKIAGIKGEFLKKQPMLDPDQVVKEALQAFLRREPYFVPRAQRSFILLTLAKILPTRLIVKIAGDMFKP